MAILEIRNLRKVFGSVIANDDVNLSLEAGETHAILGENGAGKSTLIKMISGLYKPDYGQILLNGVEQHFANPRESIIAGIGVVHQHFMLIPALSVAENVVLGSEGGRFLFRKKQAIENVMRISKELGLPLDPAIKVQDLPVGMQQRVEIVKALYRNARILILDEPTAVLTPQETEELFAVVRRLNQDQIPVIFISHKLDEVREIADRITVMRAGRSVHTMPVADATAKELAQLMVGREVVLETIKTPAQVGDVVLRVENLSVRDDRKTTRVKNVSFEVRTGEIFGIAGVDGNGQTELVEAIVGLRKLEGGKIHFLDRNITTENVSSRIQRGIGYVPQDRQRDGLVLQFSVADNLVLRSVGATPFSKSGWLQKKSTRANAEKLIKEFDIRPPLADAQVGSLSGGNQQKVILAREMAREPMLLIAVQPTRGLDVGAIEGIHRHLLSLCEQGKAVLLVSLELEEIMQLSDRIGVMHAGELVTVMDAKAATRESLGLAMTGERVEEGVAP